MARLAGLPARTVERAKQILTGLERDELSRGGRPTLAGTGADPQTQLGLFAVPSATDTGVPSRLRAADLDRMTPLDALTLLAELKREAE